MKKILVASKDSDIIALVCAVCGSHSSQFHYQAFDRYDDIISAINYTLPEIKILDFADPDIHADKILADINQDQWLLFGCVIAIVANEVEKTKLEEIPDHNIISILTIGEFFASFGRMVKLLATNNQFLFTRGMQSYLHSHESGTLECMNDPLDVNVHIKFLPSYLYHTNRISAHTRYKLQVAFNELLMNALEHGNCGITYNEKTEWLKNGKDILELVGQKNTDPEIAGRHIYISYEILTHVTKISIRDEGDGFDWRTMLASNVEPGLHGMGMRMSVNMVQHLAYNETGNIVSFDVPNIEDDTNSIPSIMQTFDVLTFTGRTVLCRQGDYCEELYFIVSGKYAVYINGKLVTMLAPKDMFIGETSFLLDNSCSATIVAIGAGKIIKLPKEEFLKMISKYPHYGIFLSRVLARRLVRQLKKNSRLESQLKEAQALGDTLDDDND